MDDDFANYLIMLTQKFVLKLSKSTARANSKVFAG